MSYVLLVEDDELNRTVIEDIFEFDCPGHELVCVDTGEAALDQVARRLPDLVLMDLRLPGIGGLETTRRLKQGSATKDVLVWALTAQAMISDKEKALAAGCSDFITKPIDPKHFVTRLCQFFETSSFDGESCPKC